MSSDPHRQFDFWLGDWEVSDPEGNVVGRNRIERLFGQIGLLERWEGASGLRGASYSVYAGGRWHQTWVDSSGTLLLLDGGLRDGTMMLEGSSRSEDDPGESVGHRISWSVMDGDRDSVRQLWEVSTDDGGTWHVAFDGRYRRIS
jgi:hypothetical protein